MAASNSDVRSLCGDACLAATYSELLGSEKADLLLTDPPYCLLTRRRKGGDLRDPKGRKIEREPAVRFESVRDYRQFTAAWLPKAVACLTAEAPLVIWTNFLGKQVIIEAARGLGFSHLWGEFVWAKRTTKATGSEQLLRVYETALVLARTPRRPLRPEDRSETWAQVAGYDDDGEAESSGGHPHHKPFGVLEPLVRDYSQPGALLLDPFGGSGSIAVAAQRLGRRVAVIEIVPEWAARIRERLGLA